MNMKTLEEMLQHEFQAFDGRDEGRFMEFCEASVVIERGYSIPEDKVWEPKEWNEENVLDQLKHDLEFAFEKALDQRGLSSAAMFHVIKMWNDALEVDITPQYEHYALPYLKATALHHGFNNPIGDDVGNELQYSSDY